MREDARSHTDVLHMLRKWIYKTVQVNISELTTYEGIGMHALNSAEYTIISRHVCDVCMQFLFPP